MTPSESEETKYEFRVMFADGRQVIRHARCHMEAVILAVADQINNKGAPLIVQVTGGDGTTINKDCYLWLSNAPIYWPFRWRILLTEAASWLFAAASLLLVAGALCWFVWELSRHLLEGAK